MKKVYGIFALLALAVDGAQAMLPKSDLEIMTTMDDIFNWFSLDYHDAVDAFENTGTPCARLSRKALRKIFDEALDNGNVRPYVGPGKTMQSVIKDVAQQAARGEAVRFPTRPQQEVQQSQDEIVAVANVDVPAVLALPSDSADIVDQAPLVEVDTETAQEINTQKISEQETINRLLDAIKLRRLRETAQKGERRSRLVKKIKKKASKPVDACLIPQCEQDFSLYGSWRREVQPGSGAYTVQLPADLGEFYKKLNNQSAFLQAQGVGFLIVDMNIIHPNSDKTFSLTLPFSTQDINDIKAVVVHGLTLKGAHLLPREQAAVVETGKLSCGKIRRSILKHAGEFKDGALVRDTHDFLLELNQ